MRGNGERIGPQNLPTSSIAGGIWNLLNQQRAQQRGAWPSATPAVTTDPYFMYVPLLLNTTSTNAQQNNTFLDSSTNNFTITRNGTPTQGAFTPYQPSGYWSGYFGGSADGLKGSITSGVTPISGDFTWEGWVYFNSLASAQCLIGVGNTQNRTILYFDNATGLTYVVARSGANQILISQGSTSGWSINTWYHFAVVRSGNNYTIYRNGTSIASGTSTYVASDLTQPLTVGYSDWSTSYLFTGGYISNVRAVYGTAIVPPAGGPTTPLTAVTGTSLLTLQDNRFKDNAATPNTMTVVGSTKVQAFQPFAPAASYSAATYGGSGYFNGSSDYLSVANNTALNLSSGDFTVECWFYMTSSAGGFLIDKDGTSGSSYVSYGISYNTAVASTLTARVGSGNGVSYVQTISSSIGVSLNTWYHVAFTKSGTTLTLWLNGVSAGTATQTGTIVDGGKSLLIGQETGQSGYFPGYISNVRIVKGTAIYTAAFTPPTLPVTAVSGTSLLANFTNAGIYDAAWQNNALTVGDAQVSTTQKQWGTTSMKFDGTGDYLDILVPNAAFNLSSGNWTIEAWIYRTQTSKLDVILSMFNTVNTNSGLSFYVNASNQLVTDNGVTAALAAGTVPSNQWVYVAIVRSGGTTTGYVNGTSVGTTTQAPNAAQYARIGFFGLSSLDPTWAFNGYIQDLRITKGVARTITTPTAAFPTR